MPGKEVGFTKGTSRDDEGDWKVSFTNEEFSTDLKYVIVNRVVLCDNYQDIEGNYREVDMGAYDTITPENFHYEIASSITDYTQACYVPLTDGLVGKFRYTVTRVRTASPWARWNFVEKGPNS
jgi:hypothetical protein